jgi:hypothetical protein
MVIEPKSKRKIQLFGNITKLKSTYPELWINDETRLLINEHNKTETVDKIN